MLNILQLQQYITTLLILFPFLSLSFLWNLKRRFCLFWRKRVNNILYITYFVLLYPPFVCLCMKTKCTLLLLHYITKVKLKKIILKIEY